MAKTEAPMAAPVAAPAPRHNGALTPDGPAPEQPVVTHWGDEGETAAPGVADAGKSVHELAADQREAKREELQKILRGQDPETANAAPPKVPGLPEDHIANDEPAAEAPVVVAVTRREQLRAIDHEKRARALEASLKEERAARAAAEAGLKGRSLAALAKERGLTTDQAVEALLMDPAEPEVAADPNPELTALKATVSELTAEKSRAEQARVAQIVQERLTPLDLPYLKAQKTIILPEADGTVRQRSTADTIVQVAQQMWLDDGQPGNDVRQRVEYLDMAAEAVESQLAEYYGPMVAALSIRAAPAPAPVTEKPRVAPVPGKRAPAASPKTPNSEPPSDPNEDEYERRLRIRASFGL